MNIDGVLAMKALEWHDNIFRSPIYRSAIWSREPLEAICRRARIIDTESHNAPYDNCKCGIWASPTPSVVVTTYGHSADNAILLMEGWGDIIFYDEGFRCQHAKIVAVVNVDGQFRTLEPGVMSRQHFTVAKAQDYFDIPLIGLVEANILMAFHWLKDKENGPMPNSLERWRKPAEKILAERRLDDVEDTQIGLSDSPIAVDFTAMRS